VEVEPTGDRKTCRPPVLKITQCVLTGYENSLLYLISQTAYQKRVLIRFDQL
jgi:hypothetical protein